MANDNKKVPQPSPRPQPSPSTRNQPNPSTNQGSKQPRINEGTGPRSKK